MRRVTGIGGIFFHAKDPEALRAWYKTHRGIAVKGGGDTRFRLVYEVESNRFRRLRVNSPT